MPSGVLIRALGTAVINSDNVTMTVQPVAGAAGAIVTCGKAAYGAWAQIVAAATVPNPTWFCGLSCDTVADTTDAAAFSRKYTLQFGTGAGGAEVGMAELGFGLVHNRATAAGEWETTWPPIWIPAPVRITGAPRIACRGATDDAAATHAISVSAQLMTSLGV